MADDAAADEARNELLEKYSAALTRIRSENTQIAGKPAFEALVDGELAAVKARIAGKDPEATRPELPAFTFPNSLDEWVQFQGEEVKIDMADKEYRMGKLLGMEVKQGDRIRVVPNPVDKIERGSLSGSWRGIDRGWIGLRIQGETRTTYLSSLQKTNFIYTAKADGKLAAVVYLWDYKGHGEFRLKLLNLDAPDADAPRPPSALTDLLAKGESLLISAAQNVEKTRAAKLDLYASALRQLARDAKAEKSFSIPDIEQEIARIGSGDGPAVIYESTPFVRPETSAEWEAIPGKLVLVVTAEKDWLDGKRIGIAVAKGDKVRLVAHPADLWGRSRYAIGTWNGSDRCSLKIGVMGQTEFKGISSGSKETGAIYECPAAGQLAFQTYVWTSGSGLGQILFKVQKLAKDPK